MTPAEIVTRLRESMLTYRVYALTYRDPHTCCKLVLTRRPESEEVPAAEAHGMTVLVSPEAGCVRFAHPLRNQRVRVGDAVPVGPLCFIESDSRLYPVESLTAGHIAQLLVREGQRVDYHAPLIVVAGCRTCGA